MKRLTYEESHKTIEDKLFKLCNWCNEWFPCTEEYFYRVKTSPDGLFPYCKECNIEKSKKSMYANYDNHLKALKKNNARVETKEIKKNCEQTRRKEGKFSKWQNENKDKIKQYLSNRQHKEHKITKDEWSACKNYFDNTCAYCGLPAEEHYIKYRGELKLGDFHKEHFNHEGSNTIENCIPSCKQCNSEKHDINFYSWYNENNSKYNIERYNKIIKWITGDCKNLTLKSKFM